MTGRNLLQKTRGDLEKLLNLNAFLLSQTERGDGGKVTKLGGEAQGRWEFFLNVVCVYRFLSFWRRRTSFTSSSSWHRKGIFCEEVRSDLYLSLKTIFWCSAHPISWVWLWNRRREGEVFLTGQDWKGWDGDGQRRWTRAYIFLALTVWNLISPGTIWQDQSSKKRKNKG